MSDDIFIKNIDDYNEFGKIRPIKKRDRTHISFICSKCHNLSHKIYGTLKIPFLCKSCQCHISSIKPDTRKKYKQTSLTKYGVENTYRIDKAIEKAKAVIQERYGVDYFFSNRDRFKEVSLERYGTEHPMQNKVISEKLSNTKFLNWGDKNYNNQKQFEKTFLERYGVTRPFYIQEFKDKSNTTKLEKYGDKNYNNREKALKLGETWKESGYNVISMRDDFKTIYGDGVVKSNNNK